MLGRGQVAWYVSECYVIRGVKKYLVAVVIVPFRAYRGTKHAARTYLVWDTSRQQKKARQGATWHWGRGA